VKYCDTCRAAYPGDFTTCPKDQSALRSITELMPGLVLRGKYEIQERLGAGGMGAVYKARHTAFGETRAIKFIGSHLIHDEEFLARFRGEAVLARKLLHPNVVRVEDLDSTEDGRPFIVMEYVVGRSLRDVLRKEGPLAPARAVDIAAQTCAALAAAHGLGVLHRDIKPENMVLVSGADGSEVVKVLDFGLAKVLEGFEGAGQQVSTQTGMVVGTPQYISPEQAVPTKGLELDGRSDLYSLGVMLYELLTGHLPFSADTPMAMVIHHLQTVPEPPHETHPDHGIPSELGALVMKALEKDRAARFASAAEMREALLLLAPGLPKTAVAAARSGAEAGGLADTALHTPRQVLSHAPTPATVLVPKLREQQKTAAAPKTAALADTTARPGSGATTRPASGALARPASGARPARPMPARPSAPSVRVKEEDEPKSRLWIYAAVLALGVTGWLAFNRSGQPAPSPSPAPAAEEAAASAEPAVPVSAAARAGDESLLAEVQQLIANSGALRDSRVEVAVANGIVTLSGEAPTTTARDLALSLASTAHGARRVFNMIEVMPASTAEPPPAAAAPGAASAATEPPATTPAAESRPQAPPPPQDDPVHQLLEKARRQIDSGDHEGAARTFEEVLRIDPNNPQAKDALERWRTHRPPPDRPHP
jgi:eukaryotic-like serine/threonine-protein kinase